MDTAEIKLELNRLVDWIDDFDQRSNAAEHTDTDEVWELLNNARVTLAKISRAIGSPQAPSRASRPTSSRRGPAKQWLVLQLHGEPPMKVPVFTLEGAQEKFEKWRDEQGLGARDLGEHAGEVLEGRVVIARISYNGRIFLVP